MRAGCGRAAYCVSGRSTPRLLTDQPDVSVGNGLVDLVPAEFAGPCLAGVAVGAAQGGILDIGPQSFGELVDGTGGDQTARHAEIGRESGRERGGQDVQIWGVAGSLKTKNKTTT